MTSQPGNLDNQEAWAQSKLDKKELGTFFSFRNFNVGFWAALIV